MAGEAEPLLATHSRTVQAAAAGADASALIVAPFAGTLAAASVVPLTALTGANTDSRTIQVWNRGQAGAGTLASASKAFVSGTNAPALTATAITLSATATDLVVAAGDVFEVKSLHVGATGLACPLFLAQLQFSRVAGA